MTVSGGVSLLSHTSNLLHPIVPLTHLRSFHSKELRINFLNSLIGWNLATLEHLEIVDHSCVWEELLGQSDDEDSVLDPLVYAAWRCARLHTVLVGVKVGDLFVVDYCVKWCSIAVPW